MKSETKKDLIGLLIGIIGGAFTLFLPVWLWNVKYLDYIDKHGKLVAWGITLPIALISAGLFVGVADLHSRMFGRDLGPREGGREINPFWGWAICAWVIELVIVALSNT